MQGTAVSTNVSDVLNQTKSWLQDISKDNIYTKIIAGKPTPRRWTVTPCLSPEIKINEMPTDHKIILVQQFFINSDPNRQNEIRNCLKFNCHNLKIDKILLLNERLYDENELGITDKKIEQVVIEERLTYKKVFDYVQNEYPNSTIVLANSDIFFDASIANVNKVSLDSTRSILCQSRIEYRLEQNLSDCVGIDRHDSQDVWIWNSSSVKLDTDQLKLIDFNMGKPGCDNRIIFLMDLFSIVPYNIPLIVKCYHYHNVEIRNYSANDLIKPEYIGLFPYVLGRPDVADLTPTFLKSVDSIRFSNSISNTSNSSSVVRLLNKDAVLLIQIIGLLQSNNTRDKVIVYARDNGLNVTSFEELHSWMIKTRVGLSNADFALLKHPLSNTKQLEDLAMSSYFEIYKTKRSFDDSILHWYIAKTQKWFSDKNIVIVSPYNQILCQHKHCNITSKSITFVDIDVTLKASDMLDNIVKTTKTVCEKLDAPLVLLATELYDSALSGILKDEGISSFVVGEYIFGYFNYISNHPQEEWHKAINNVNIDKLTPLTP